MRVVSIARSLHSTNFWAFCSLFAPNRTALYFELTVFTGT